MVLSGSRGYTAEASPSTVVPANCSIRVRYPGPHAAWLRAANDPRSPVSPHGYQQPALITPTRPVGVSLTVKPGRRQIPYLPPGDTEPDAVLAEPGHHLGRDGGIGAAPRGPVPDQHVGHPAAARVDAHGAEVPGLAVRGVHAVVPAVFHLACRVD